MERFAAPEKCSELPNTCVHVCTNSNPWMCVDFKHATMTSLVQLHRKWVIWNLFQFVLRTLWVLMKHTHTWIRLLRVWLTGVGGVCLGLVLVLYFIPQVHHNVSVVQASPWNSLGLKRANNTRVAIRFGVFKVRATSVWNHAVSEFLVGGSCARIPRSAWPLTSGMPYGGWQLIGWSKLGLLIRPQQSLSLKGWCSGERRGILCFSRTPPPPPPTTPSLLGTEQNKNLFRLMSPQLFSAFTSRGMKDTFAPCEASLGFRQMENLILLCVFLLFVISLFTLACSVQGAATCDTGQRNGHMFLERPRWCYFHKCKGYLKVTWTFWRRVFRRGLRRRTRDYYWENTETALYLSLSDTEFETDVVVRRYWGLHSDLEVHVLHLQSQMVFHIRWC